MLSPNSDFYSETARMLEAAERISIQSQAEAGAVDVETGFPAETFRLIIENNLLRAALPIEFGGLGLSGARVGTTLPLLLLLKHLGRGNLAVGRVFEGHVNALLLLELYADKAQQQFFAAETIENNKIFGVWNTEAGDGVRIARTNENNFRLSGAKTFASGSGFVDRPFVNGALPGAGWQMCIVPMEQVETRTDESWWQPIGMRATRSFKVDFTNVELRRKYLIGDPDDYYKQPWFGGGAIRFAAVQLGGAEALFDQTRQYLRDLKRIDDPYQKQRLGEMAILVNNGELWLRAAAEAVDVYLQSSRQAVDSERFLAFANMMRTAIEEICLRTMTLCERAIGARGLMRNLGFERIIRDLTIYLRQPAPDQALADVGRFVLNSEQPQHRLWRDEF